MSSGDNMGGNYPTQFGTTGNVTTLEDLCLGNGCPSLVGLDALTMRSKGEEEAVKTVGEKIRECVQIGGCVLENGVQDAS